MPRMKSRKKCTAGCPVGGHQSWGECLRAKGVSINPNLMDTSKQKSWDRELDNYESARKQGIEPAGTSQKKIDEAMKLSDASGVAYKA